MTNKIDLFFSPESSFLLGGVSINPAYDSITALDENNLPYLTATAIKGALRMEFEAFVRGIGEQTLCDFDTDIRGCATCLSCRLFGGGNQEGKLRFNAAVLENAEDLKNISRDLLEKGKRQGVSISRILGKSKDKSYFSTLTFPNLKNIRSIAFTTSIDIRRQLDDTEKQYLDTFLALMGKIGIFMGSRKSVGLGYFTIRYELPGEFTQPNAVDYSRTGLKLFKVTLETLEPLLVGNTKNQYIIDTLPFIPASTLGGTIGFKLSEYGVDDNNLERMFIANNTFSTFNCYLESPFPVPLSQRREKGKKEPVKDILLADYIIKQAVEQGRFTEVESLYNALYKKNNLRPVPICQKPATFYNKRRRAVILHGIDSKRFAIPGLYHRRNLGRRNPPANQRTLHGRETNPRIRQSPVHRYKRNGANETNRSRQRGRRPFEKPGRAIYRRFTRGPAFLYP